MRFAYPLGLLGLLAIPVLILIYIIKSKYTEQTITSTYLWTLSERFLKRKNPINKITGIISLILQILAVILISWALAHPIFTLPGKALDYCFILDGSGSMQTVQGGESRFERGKDRIRDIISSAADGSTFTLITTGNTTDLIMKEVDDKKSAIRRVDAVEPSYAASNLSRATKLANDYFLENPSCKFYLLTDREVQSHKNVEVINLAGNVTNYALDEVAYSFNSEGKIIVTGKALSYENDATLTVQVYVDNSRSPAGSTDVQLTTGEGKDFTVTLAEEQFASLTVSIRQSDNLSLDNRVVLYNSRSDASYKTLIVSNQPFFINATLGALGNIKRDTVTPDEYTKNQASGAYKGYGLYVFQNYTPEEMPRDGAVWFINPDKSVDETSGFTRRGVETLKNPTRLKLNESSANRIRNLLKNTDPNEGTFVNEYLKCGMTRNFTTLMYCGDDPVLFAGSNSYGNREVVFAFDLIETSDFALSYNGRIILYNLIGYTFPSLVDQTNLYCGDSLEVNVLANCTGIRVVSPSGKAEYLSTSDAISEYELTEVGEYTVIATIGNVQQSAKVYSQMPLAERILNATEQQFKIESATTEPSDEKRDGRYEDLLYAFIILAVIVVADWGVYCYEQYQLR